MYAAVAAPPLDDDDTLEAASEITPPWNDAERLPPHNHAPPRTTSHNVNVAEDVAPAGSSPVHSPQPVREVKLPAHEASPQDGLPLVHLEPASVEADGGSGRTTRAGRHRHAPRPVAPLPTQAGAVREGQQHGSSSEQHGSRTTWPSDDTWLRDELERFDTTFDERPRVQAEGEAVAQPHLRALGHSGCACHSSRPHCSSDGWCLEVKGDDST